jgi:hypothetical protein
MFQTEVVEKIKTHIYCSRHFFRKLCRSCDEVEKYGTTDRPHMMIQDRQCTYKRNIETRFRNHCCRRKAISIPYSECVSVALVIQN